MAIRYRDNSVRQADGHYNASEVPSAAIVRYDVTICRADSGEEVLVARNLHRSHMHELRDMFVRHDHGYLFHVTAHEFDREVSA